MFNTRCFTLLSFSAKETFIKMKVTCLYSKHIPFVYNHRLGQLGKN